MFVNIRTLLGCARSLGSERMALPIDQHSNLSEYAQSLVLKDRECYLNKLTLTNGYRLPDPYALKEWVDDISKLPSIQWPDIYTYLIDKPSLYTHDKLRAYKSLDAYNYVVCGHVQTVLYTDIDENFCAMKSDILPSQRQGKKGPLYEAWVLYNKMDGYVLTANCTCMAG